MPQRAKVNQRSRSFQTRPENQGKRNMFDLSHDHKLTLTMGKLVPILTVETLPGDDWFIRGEFMMRFAPLYLPIMHRVNMSVDYFYVPNRIMWPKNTNAPGGWENSGWEDFIFNQSSGITHPNYEYLPVDYVGGAAGELPVFMGFPSIIDPLAPAAATFIINAFPIYAYYMIYDQYYRNDQVQGEIIEGPLEAGTNVEPADPGALQCKYRNWNRDYYTSATPEPQLGADVLIPLVDVDYMDPVTGTEYNGPYRWRQRSDDTPAIASDLVVGAGGPLGHTEAGAEPVYLDIQETAGSIAALRYALMLQEFLERGMRVGDRYSDRMKGYFGENPYKGVIQVPEFLGSKKGRVVVSEVMSTTETATLKVGNYAGQALALESLNDTIKYHCSEHGIILGILSVYPDSSYFQGMERMWFRELNYDYAWEQFALIGDQQIFNKEVNLDTRLVPTDPDYNESIFGYIPRYSEYRYKNDIVSGLMRTTFISFHLGRELSATNPENTVLDSIFLQCRPDVTRVFQVAEAEDEIYAHVYNDIKVQRRLPKFGIPAV